jgi:hypothetical protein
MEAFGLYRFAPTLLLRMGINTLVKSAAKRVRLRASAAEKLFEELGPAQRTQNDERIKHE